jgi:hypothetical protein
MGLPFLSRTAFFLSFFFPACLIADEPPPAKLPIQKLDASLKRASESCRAPLDRVAMHSVIIVDTNDQKLGELLRFDYANLSKFLLTPLFQHGQLGYCDVLYGFAATPSNVVREIQSVPVGRNDTLLVFFAGHGGMHDGDLYLKMNGSSLSHRRVAQEMANKRSRLSVLVTDCCSTYDQSMLQTNTNQKTNKNANWETIRDLFFNLRGNVTVTSAKPGQPSYASVFTSAFCETLADSPQELALDKRGNWSRFFQKVDARTKQHGQECSFYFGPWRKW